MEYDENNELHFLNQLPLSNALRKKISTLGASNSYEILTRRNASRKAFDNYIGISDIDNVIEVLFNSLTDEERQRLAEPCQNPFRLGAIIKKKQ